MQVRANIEFKLLNVLAIGLVTLAMLSPVLAVCGLLWHHHVVYAANSRQLTTAAGSDTAIEILLSAIFFAPIGLCLGISLYDRHHLDRAAKFKKQVEMLERLWQQSIYSEEAMS